jgi:acetyl esterase/lipase
MDIYLPDSGKAPYPVIVVVHGGAFSMGNAKMKTDVKPMLEGLKHGYAVISVNYRLSGEACFPRAVNDVKAAVRFIRANAKKYNFNPDKIAAWGGSAGGNLVSMLGSTGNNKTLDGDNTENLQFPSNVQAVVDWFGPCDFTRFDAQFIELGFKEHNSSIGDDSQESWYIGQNVTKDTVLTMKANPMTYIPTLDINTAPYFFIQHGTLDPVVPITQSINFYNALKAKLGADKVKYEALPGAHHFSPEFSTDQNLQKVISFLDKVLK